MLVEGSVATSILLIGLSVSIVPGSRISLPKTRWFAEQPERLGKRLRASMAAVIASSNSISVTIPNSEITSRKSSLKLPPALSGTGARAVAKPQPHRPAHDHRLCRPTGDAVENGGWPLRSHAHRQSQRRDARSGAAKVRRAHSGRCGL